MATLVLSSAGAALGTVLGGPIGSVVGRVLGAGPRLTDVSGLTSTEGEPIPRVYGRARIGGTLIWATRPLEVANTTVERTASGAKGAGATTKTVRTSYSYFANLAVGLCEGPVAAVRRIWADGTEIDLTAITLRIHEGREDQAPDPLIVAKEGFGNAPAYRGLAYAVLEGLPLAPYGNRVPQFTFEVLRPVDGLAQRIRAVCLIPGSTEFGYDTEPVTEDLGLGTTRPANRFQYARETDVAASLDAMQALLPNLRHVSLVASWFGDDLRAGVCTVAPRVDLAGKTTLGDAWSVAGLTREAARVVSTGPDGTPAYGGTPSDAGLQRLVLELKARGLAVTLYPFVMMDVPQGNALPDPRAPGSLGQPAYPWRGRITCDPAPGVAGSVEGTAEAAAQVERFFTGGAWNFRRLVLHYAGLAAGFGLDGFVLGSELVGLTRVQGPGGGYPAVEALRALAAEVRAILGPDVPLVYAADWTEYGADVRAGGAQVRFPLDPLFSDPAITAVGIDYYPPISDWRDGTEHADIAEAESPYDPHYLLDRLGSGEAFDWYYADDADRAAQRRTPITDGAHGKPWIYRPKDLVSWWSNAHVERAGGVETGPTAWRPRGKPIWLTETGIPAVDKGPNGPNVFPDPKSSENAYPPFSHGRRDPLAQAAGLSAILTRFDPAAPDHPAGANPAGPGGLLMVDPARVYVWAWDARPYPAFPAFDTVWADAANWRVGHWITGRIEGAPLDRLVAAILSDYGLDPAEIAADGFVEGYVIDRPMSPRAALEGLASLFGLDVGVRAGTVRITGRDRRRTPLALARADLVAPEDADDPILTRVRGEESELPLAVEIDFTDAESDGFRRATAASRRLIGTSRRVQSLDTAAVMRRDAIQDLADAWLQEAWAARESASFSLSPRALDLEPGDVVALPDVPGLHRITRIVDEPGGRRIETAGTEPALRLAPASPPGATLSRSLRAPAIIGPPAVAALDLAAAQGDPPALQALAVAADPWPGAAAVYRAAGEDGAFRLQAVADWSATLGVTLDPLPPGPLWRFDRVARVTVRFNTAASLAAIPDADALAGKNLFAILGPDGLWEILCAADAALVGPQTWHLSRLLRGLAGSEAQAGRPVPAGARVVRLDDGAVIPLVTAVEEAGRPWRYRVGPASRDPADPSFVAFTATAGLDALKPFAPVHLRARRTADGVALTWIRRTRVGGDAWEAAEVPLAEEREAYALDIRAGDAVLRSFATDAPALLYPAALEAADFGGPQTTLAVALAQVSAVAGRGFERRATLTVE